MNKTLNTILLVLAILVLAGGIFFAGTMYARSNMFFASNMMNNGGMMNGQDGINLMGGGGMMNGNGSNMMDGYNNINVPPLTIDQVTAAAEKYMKALDVAGLELGEVMIFDNNGYVVVKESETGTGAFELLVDPASQSAYPEHGPNMMWNVKYSGLNHRYMTLAPGASAGVGNGSGMMGMMGGGNGMMQDMMGGLDSTVPNNVPTAMTVTPEQAIEYAQGYLDANMAGATAAGDPITFYGYYTLDFEKDGNVAGMLSVNGYSGQVFLHTWHGTFIEETE